MTILPFDAHNHVHLGPSPAIQAINIGGGDRELGGMAIQGTHPRDYERILGICKDISSSNGSERSPRRVRVVPCFGVHPWFLHELQEEDWKPITTTVEEGDNNKKKETPKWIHDLSNYLAATPNAIVGEIGLDGFHYKDPETRELCSSMENQVEAFRMQMELAIEFDRPVSIHSVQSHGPLLETLAKLKNNNSGQQRRPLPPVLYFHAFGGKIGLVDQLLALGRGGGKKKKAKKGRTMESKIYFGFAPIVNFRSPKTKAVIQKIGIERIVLESDHEDASEVPSSMNQCIQYLSDALQLSEEQVIEQTTQNAYDLYGLSNNQ